MKVYFPSPFLFPQILSTEVNPNAPKANAATALTSGVDGAIDMSVKLLAIIVTHNDNPAIRPIILLDDGFPFSSLSNPLTHSNIFVVMFDTFPIILFTLSINSLIGIFVRCL